MKPTKSWAALLQQELAKPEPAFTPEHKTREEICAEFKKAGLPYGNVYVQKVLRRLIADGRATAVEAMVPNVTGSRVRCVKYLLK